MSSQPECQKCGDYIHSGPVICGKCSEWNAAIEAAAKVAKKYISTFDELADAKDDAHKFLAIRVTTMVAETIATEIRALSKKD